MKHEILSVITLFGILFILFLSFWVDECECFHFGFVERKWLIFFFFW